MQPVAVAKLEPSRPGSEAEPAMKESPWILMQHSQIISFEIAFDYTYHIMVGTPLPVFRAFGTYKITDKQSSDIAESSTLS